MELVNPSAKIVVIGEAMLELSRSGEFWQLGYGGDTLNTAIHLSRMQCRTAYMTALGTDAFSEDLLRAWSAEGLDTSLVLTSTDRGPGLYAIRTDDAGERSFHYWRESSAARQMFDVAGSEAAIASAGEAGLLLFSLITLAILTPAARQRLLSIARDVRSSGGLVAFDSNYRPALWRSAAEARQVRDEAIACCDIGLPTLADEQALSDAADPQSVAEYWSASGVREVVVKLGQGGCYIAGETVPTPAAAEPVDTSGAGDAFNAGYLAARLLGRDCRDAAISGHRLAGWVIARRGAIPPRDVEAPYEEAGTARG